MQMFVTYDVWYHDCLRIPGTVVSLSYSQLMSTLDTLEKMFVSNQYWTIIYRLNAVFKPAIGLYELAINSYQNKRQNACFEPAS